MTRRKMPSRWEQAVRRCAAAASISTCAATCPTRATRNSSSRCRWRRKATSSPGTCAGCRNCGSRSDRAAGARRHAGRPIKADAPGVVLPDREKMKTQMEALIYHFKIITEGFAVPAGEVYQAVESPRGEMGYYIVSDGTAKPYRVHMRSACLANLQTLPKCAKAVAGGCGGGDWQHRYCAGRD
jgi:hypothetical protein